MCYSTGIARFFGPTGVYSMYIVTFFAYGGLIQSIVVALFFRVSRLYTSTSFLHENKKTWLKIGLVVLIICEIMFMGKSFLEFSRFHT